MEVVESGRDGAGRGLQREFVLCLSKASFTGVAWVWHAAKQARNVDGGWVESATKACLRCRLSLTGVKRRDHGREGRHIHEIIVHQSGVLYVPRTRISLDEEECQTQARRRRNKYEGWYLRISGCSCGRMTGPPCKKFVQYEPVSQYKSSCFNGRHPPEYVRLLAV